MSSRKPQSNPLTSVKVTVRIRPTTSQDNHSIPSRWQKTVVQPSSPSSINIDGSSFSFDRVHGPSDTQDVVYNDNVEKLVQSFVDGYNITVLAYGQTSSGKSYTSEYRWTSTCPPHALTQLENSGHKYIR